MTSATMQDEPTSTTLATLGKDLEEKESSHLEKVLPQNQYANIGLSHDEGAFFDTFTGSPEHKKLLRKIDVRLLPLLGFLYLAAHIDRANIGNAKIEGMDEDLGLTGYQYNIALSIFFVPYICGEIPSNVLLKKFSRPSWYLGTLTIIWGIVMTCTGFVKDFSGLMACRFFLGVFESGFFPGAVFLVTGWYAARELQTRIAAFYTASAFSGAFSGLLAFAIAKMDGIGNLPGWAWIFILEGLATVAMGALCFLTLPDSPSLSGGWMNEDEKKYMELMAVVKNGGRSTEETEKFKWSILKDVVLDPKLWLQAYILFMLAMCTYGLKFTMPSITQSMGYTSSQAQLLTIPPYISGAIAAIGLGLISDRYQWRLPFIIGPMSLVLVGFCILLALADDIQNQIPACYVAVMFLCIGQYPANPASYAWIGSNVAPDTKRAVALGFHLTIGNCGGILGSYMFLDREEPGYPTGFGIGVAITITALIASLVLELSYETINRKREAMSVEEIQERYTHDELAMLGDKSPLYRHKL